MAAKLGILAGSGELPLRLIEACRAQHRPYFVLGFAGFCDPDTLVGQPHAFVRLGAGGSGLKLLRQNGVEELVFAGGVRRPSLRELRPDWRAIRFSFKVGTHMIGHWGDDALFRTLIAVLEDEGFRVVGVDTILTNLLAPRGPLGRLMPDEIAEADIRAGIEAARSHGAQDLGQAVIVRSGAVIDREDVAGTDALIRRCGTSGNGAGAVLVKIAKPGQERRADLPAIGPKTVAAAKDAGLRGMAIEAGACLILDRDAVVAAADDAGIFVVGISP